MEVNTDIHRLTAFGSFAAPDKGYDADHFVDSLKVRAITPVIPPKSNRKIKRDCDFALYAERALVEHFFNAIKHFRGATRYEKTARNYHAGLQLVCALAWLKWRHALIKSRYTTKSLTLDRIRDSCRTSL